MPVYRRHKFRSVTLRREKSLQRKMLHICSFFHIFLEEEIQTQNHTLIGVSISVKCLYGAPICYLVVFHLGWMWSSFLYFLIEMFAARSNILDVQIDVVYVRYEI